MPIAPMLACAQADTPSVDVPSSINVTTNSTTTISGLSIVDPWAQNAPGSMVVNLSVSTGTLVLTGASGSGTASLSYTGTLNQINSALGTLAYKSTANTGSATFTINPWNQAGNNSTATTTINIAVGGPDTPSVTVPSTINVTANSTTTISGLSIVDPWAQNNPGNMTVNLSVTAGTLTLSGASGTGTASLSYSGTLNQINSALLRLAYNSPASTGTATFTVNPWNQAGNNSTATATIDIGTGSGGGDPSGTQAYRVADMMERFGVNTFAMNAGGPNPEYSAGDYSPDDVTAALNWLTDGSGLTMYDREYHWDGYGSDPTYITNLQSTWCPQVNSGTGAQFTMAPASGAPASASVDGILQLAQQSASSNGWMKWVEGMNEPNQNNVAASDALAAQEQLFAGAPSGIGVVLPSITFGLPYPEQYTTSSFPTLANYIAPNTIAPYGTIANLHVYPSTEMDIDDGSNRKGELGDIATGFNTEWPGYPQLITEWHPTLYNSEGHNLDPTYDAYYAPMFILSGFTHYNFLGYIWFSLFDYSSSMQAGLFVSDSSNPKPVANTIRAMYGLTGDQGSTKHTFSPSKVNYSISGLPSPVNGASPYTGGQSALFQNSAGTYFLYVWNGQDNPGGTATPVTIQFNSHAMTSVSEYNISSTSPQTVLQSWSSASSITIQLDASVRLFVIHY
ncbi:MAG TPA: hypothetical protein VG267_01495 [Terracidiphilus sp.]|nr:hypothetical protein [Terracidiphilus sp.]